jgi:hypothetical protein
MINTTTQTGRKARPVYCDDWYTVKGRMLYVDEKGTVRRAMKEDTNGFLVPAAIYKTCKTGGWDNAGGTRFETVRAGIYRGTYEVY